MKKILLLAVDGCISSSISNLIDGFTLANLWYQALSGDDAPLLQTRIVSPDGQPVVCGDCIRIEPHHSFKDRPEADYLIIPAFIPLPKPEILAHASMLEYIRREHASGTVVGSVCTGAFLLAQTGLLNGRSATTNWFFERKFRHRYPEVDLRIDSILTECDNLLCSGAVTAIMHLALRIIRREGSSRLASVCAKAMLVDPNSDSQAPYAVDPLPVKHRDGEMRKAEEYMRKNLGESMTIDQVAKSVGISPRHFKRRFKSATGDSPITYLQKLRVQKAREELENSLASVEEITRRIGYEDSSTFRRLFKRYTGLSPREYRDRFLLLDGG